MSEVPRSNPNRYDDQINESEMRNLVRENKKTNENILIVPLEMKHLSEVHEIEKECFTDPWTEEMFADLLSNPLAVYYVAVDCGGAKDSFMTNGEVEGKVVGYAGMYHILSEGQIHNIAVTEKYRNKKIAQELFSTFLDYAKNEDIEIFTLEVRSKNASAISLYHKLGFEKVGVRKNYYSNPTDNAVLMNLDI